MFTLTDNVKHSPFAIIKDANKIESIEDAIKAEYGLDSVSTGSILLPDWGDSDVFSWGGINGEGDKMSGNITITRLVTY